MSVCLLAFATLGVLPGANPLRGEAAAADQPSPIAARFGVNQPHIKLSDPATMERVFSEMAAAGIGWARIDFAWPDLEPTRGKWEFAGADLAVANARSHGIKLLGILGCAPTWASGGFWFTFPPTDMAAWRNYVSTVCSRYRGVVPAWEIWNEENIHQFWLPWPDANVYVALAAQAAPAIRAADPAAKVVMGGVAGLDPNYLDACFKAGVLEHVDAVAYHPYAETMSWGNYTPQEPGARYIVSWLRNQIKQYTAKPVEIWITELGWSTSTPSPPGVDQATQGIYMMRTFINYADLGIDRVISYNFWDEMNNPQDIGYNYGVLSNDFSRKQSFNYFKVFQETFGRAVNARTGAAAFSCSSPGSLEAHSFDLPDGSLLMGVWKADDLDDRLTITLNSASYSEPVLLDAATGQRQAAAGVSRGPDGKVTIAGLGVGKRPVILEFAPVSVPRVISVAPPSGAVGAEATISGAGFGASRAASTVSFGATLATEYTAWSADQVKCRVPALQPGAVQLAVTTGGGTSNPTRFTVTTPGPTVGSIAPKAAVEGTTLNEVCLLGTGFGPGATVTLAGSGSTIAATSVNVASSTRITCSFSFQVGQARSYDVVVRNADGCQGTLPGGFTVSAAQCGAGGAPAVLVLGLAMGLVTMAGLCPARRKPRRPA